MLDHSATDPGNPFVLKAGDVIFVESFGKRSQWNSFAQRLSVLFARDISFVPTHAAIMIDDHRLLESSMDAERGTLTGLELPRGTRYHFWIDFFHDKELKYKSIRIMRHNSLILKTIEIKHYREYLFGDYSIFNAARDMNFMERKTFCSRLCYTILTSSGMIETTLDHSMITPIMLLRLLKKEGWEDLTARIDWQPMADCLIALSLNSHEEGFKDIVQSLGACIDEQRQKVREDHRTMNEVWNKLSEVSSLLQSRPRLEAFRKYDTLRP